MILDWAALPAHAWREQRGVTRYPGLYFIALPWLSKFQSGLMLGVGGDAGYIVAKIAG